MHFSLSLKLRSDHWPHLRATDPKPTFRVIFSCPAVSSKKSPVWKST